MHQYNKDSLLHIVGFKYNLQIVRVALSNVSDKPVVALSS